MAEPQQFDFGCKDNEIFLSMQIKKEENLRAGTKSSQTWQ